MHFDTYVKVTQLIADYCEQRGFRVALRFSNTEMDSTDPQSIMQRVNEYVVYHRPQNDITQEIIQFLGTASPQVGGRADGLQNR